MKHYAQKFSRGRPRYGSVGSTISALSISPDTLRAAQEADAQLRAEVGENQFLPAATPAAGPPRPGAARP